MNLRMLNFDILSRFSNYQFQIVCQIPIWASCYKAEPEEIERQILIAHAWCENNPGKAPRKNVMRFLNNWMSLADRKSTMRRTSKPVIRAPDPEPDMSFEEMVAIREKNMGATCRDLK